MEQERKQQEAPDTVLISGISELRKLIEEIPEGTVYSLDLSEVILTDE